MAEKPKKANSQTADFHADRPMQKLLTDISEIQCVDEKLYVSPVLDCFSGEVLALEMRDNMKKELCIDTVRQLQAQYGKLLQSVIRTAIAAVSIPAKHFERNYYLSALHRASAEPGIALLTPEWRAFLLP